MHRLSFFVTALSLFGAVTIALSQEKTDRRIGKPAPGVVVANPTFELKVETKPRFPNENRPSASTPVEEKSLSVTLQPEKSEFAGNGPLSFLVTFENKSKSPILLEGLNHIGASPKLVISNQGNANQWSINGDFKNATSQAVELGSGESKTYTLVVEANVGLIPRPIPFPRPMPLPGRILEEAAPAGQPEKAKRILPPVNPPIVIGPSLPCGEGKCRAMLLMEFEGNPRQRLKHPAWTGKIATGTVDFQVGQPQPIAVPPIGVVPLNKERAILLAKAAAERALNANYQPVGPKPIHGGEWISDPEKTANVTEKKTGGWSIAWTQFPKHGFSYNVKVDVDSQGVAIVREVFAGYSE